MTDPSHIMLIRITITVLSMKLHLSLTLLSSAFNTGRLGLTVFDRQWRTVLFMVLAFHSCKIRLDRKISSLGLVAKRVGTFCEQPAVGIDLYRGVGIYPEVCMNTQRIVSLARRTTLENDNNMSVEICHASKNVHLMVH